MKNPLLVAVVCGSFLVGCSEPETAVPVQSAVASADASATDVDQNSTDSTDTPGVADKTPATEDAAGAKASSKGALARATFGNGCFWCTEAVFQELEGIESVVSGFAGGRSQDVSYYEVASGRTGHAEVVQIDYDPQKITYKELLEVFWKSHDPTTLNRQGADVGPQYRSIILYHDEQQEQLARTYKKRLNDEKAFANPVVTQIVPYTGFVAASEKHQDYFDINRRDGYCQAVIQPKVDKVRKVFADKLKKNKD